MLRVEEFQHQNQTCYRKEKEGCPVVVTEQSHTASCAVEGPPPADYWRSDDGCG